MTNPYSSPSIRPQSTGSEAEILDEDELARKEYFERIKNVKKSGLKRLIWGSLIFFITVAIWVATGRLFYYLFPLGLFMGAWGGFSILFSKILVDNNYA